MQKIGEKIKSLRLSKRMTQNELAGDQITRNMLSLVENGSALPSLQTIMYLSERLEVPAGIFLAREGEELVYKKMSELVKIKNTFKSREYKLCSAMCENLLLEGNDDEVSYILSLCHFEIAKELFNTGRLHSSCEAFDLACSCAEDTIYGGEIIRSSAAVYFDYMLRLSPTLTSELGYDSYDGEYVLTDPFCRYARVVRAIESGNDFAAKLYISEYENKDKCFCEHIKAIIEMSNNDFSSAYERLKKLINDTDCRAIMYDIFKNLETCCREIGDYKSAYEYSVGKVELLEHLLAQTNL